MAKARNSMEVMAQKAAARIAEARRAGQQISFLPDEPGAPPVDTVERKAGRPKGATGKGSSALRKFLAAKGMRMPEDVLAEMAGLASSDSALLTAMAEAEQVLAWAFDRAKDKDGNDRMPTPEQRMAMFAQLYTSQLRAADALMPYGSAKVTPDQSVNQTVLVNVASGPSAAPDPAAQARDVSPASDRRMVPADVRHNMQQNQRVTDAEPDNSDGENRTDEAND